MKSASFYIMFNEDKNTNPIQKTLVLGPMKAPKTLYTTPNFYTKDEKTTFDFALCTIMMPDGTKTIDLTLQNLKCFLRLDMLFALQKFFMDAFPKYDNLKEQPANFDKDRGNDPKFAFMVHLSDSLVCFEQLMSPTFLNIQE